MMSIRGKRSARAIRFILMWGLGVSWVSSAPLRVVGSDLLSDGFTAAVMRFGEERGIEIEVKLEGSLKGRRALEAEQAEVALISMAPDEKGFAVEFSAEPLAYHISAMWVPRELSLPHLSFVQLAEIFGSTTIGDRKRWRDYGAQGKGSSRLALPRSSEDGVGLSLALLEYELGGAMHSNAASIEEREESGDNVSLLRVMPEVPPTGSEWVAVAISREEQGRAYLPTDQNVHGGDYPLQWPLQLVFRRDEVEKFYPLLRFLLSSEVAQEIRRSHLMSIPETDRQARIFKLERL